MDGIICFFFSLSLSFSLSSQEVRTGRKEGLKVRKEGIKGRKEGIKGRNEGIKGRKE
jgi:hypothetical protein